MPPCRTANPSLDRALGAATILAGLKLDPDSIRAALLLGLPVAGTFEPDAIAAEFGADVATLVAGVARMGVIRTAPSTGNPDERAAQAENLRKMLLSMVEDIRVVLIKLAERTQALRALMAGDEVLRKQVAREVLDLFAPLANRLGVWQLKWELEDLCLRALEPDAYRSIAGMLDERRLDRQNYIEDVLATLQRELKVADVAAEVSGRPKHIYSIWNKMRRKQTGIDALYDIRAVRILVDSVKDCYAALGIVHQLWTPLAREFDDYIAKPKANNYRSLHTAVIGPAGKPLEVQIRTREMHQHSEYGVAAHWRYKEGALKGVRHDPSFDEKIAWLRQVLDWKDAVADSGDWLSAFKESLFTDSIYVLTPQGKVVDLQRGSTPVDFAYAVHTNLGHRCRGAKVDGQMVPLHYVLTTGSRSKSSRPRWAARRVIGSTLTWVMCRVTAPAPRYGNGFARNSTSRRLRRGACSSSANWRGRATPRSSSMRWLRRPASMIRKNSSRHSRATTSIPSRCRRQFLPWRCLWRHAPAVAAPEVQMRKSRAAGSGGGILVVGVDRLLTGLARCCKPAPPDPIAGFVTRGKGITIHRASCINVTRMRATQPERLITADWGAPRDEVFPVDIVVEAMDRQGLLRDISEILSREKINVTAANTLTRNMQTRMAFTVEVQSLAALKRALALVCDVPGVTGASRR